MSWLKKNSELFMPAVPDDERERHDAIKSSRHSFLEALKQVRPVTELADTVEAHNQRNHYRDRLMKAYGGN